MVFNVDHFSNHCINCCSASQILHCIQHLITITFKRSTLSFSMASVHFSLTLFCSLIENTLQTKTVYQISRALNGTLMQITVIANCGANFYGFTTITSSRITCSRVLCSELGLKGFFALSLCRNQFAIKTKRAAKAETQRVHVVRSTSRDVKKWRLSFAIIV